MRACDVCRRRKKQCKTREGASSCMTCQLLNISECTFLEPPPRKRRPLASDVATRSQTERPRTVTPPRANNNLRPPQSHAPTSTPPVSLPLDHDHDDNDDHPLSYPENSLLNKTLGLEKGRHSEYLGPSGEHDLKLLRTSSSEQSQTTIPPLQPATATAAAGNQNTTTRPHASTLATMRSVHAGIFFQLMPDAPFSQHAKRGPRDHADVDAIEAMVRPHGPALISLYFRIVHPSFPILHKEVFIEKYHRTYQEIVPHLLAAVYALALRWWSYDADLGLVEKVDEAALAKIAHQSVQDAMHYPRLNTVQAGLLLLQRHRDGLSTDNASTWSFTASLIGLGQHLGLHLDCSDWAIPVWEKGLRRRLAWALFIQDTFSAMILGRPCMISPTDWAVMSLQPGDFSEGSQDEDACSDGGSVSIEDGKLLLIEFAKLSVITARVLRQLYSVQSLATAIEPEQVIALVVPLGNELAQLLKNLHPSLTIDSLQPGRLCINGNIHLAFHATTVILHRRVFWALQDSSKGVDAQFARVFRSAQRQRAANFVQLVSRLRPEHMEAFWLFAAGGCGVILGGFLGLLRATSTTAEESEEIKALMTNFEWQLRIKAKMGEWISYTLTRLRALGWDEWKTLQPEIDASVIEQGGPFDETVLSGNAAEVLRQVTIPSYFTIEGWLPPAVPGEDRTNSWLIDDIDGVALSHWAFEGL